MTARRELAGQRFGRWTVLCYGESRNAKPHWHCRCDCGTKKMVAATSLVSGASESCGCLHGEITAKINFIDLTGKRFGRLTVLHRAKNRGHHSHWHCRCDCGKEKVISATSMKTGHVKTCGCIRQDEGWRHQQRLGSTKHGHHLNNCPSPEYKVWCGMKSRCTNPKNTSFKYYGGRGITVCERWLESFENFLADMGRRPRGTTLDRKEVDGNYEPGNCRWATSREQADNKQPLVVISLRSIDQFSTTELLAELQRRQALQVTTAEGI